MQNFIRSLGEQITNKELTEKILQFFSDIPTTSHVLNKLRLIRQEADEPIVNYNQQYQNLVERVEGCKLNNITSMVAMELYLGSIIEPIQKSIRNALYFNSKHAPKTLGEAMQKAQDLHIKHLYALGEDQQDSSTTSSTDALPEIRVNEVIHMKKEDGTKVTTSTVNILKTRRKHLGRWGITHDKRTSVNRLMLGPPWTAKIEKLLEIGGSRLKTRLKLGIPKMHNSQV